MPTPAAAGPVLEWSSVQRMFETIKSQFGGLDIFVSNARATLATGFYAEPMEIPLEAWQATFDTQATEFLVAVRKRCL